MRTSAPYHIKNIDSLRDFSRNLIKKIKPPTAFLLCGELGVGKTTFVRYFAEELGFVGLVNSPSFNLLNIYESVYSAWGELFIYHFDFYRLKESKNPGIRELLEIQQENYICFVEWPDAVKMNWDYLWESMGAEVVRLSFEYQENDQDRIIKYA